MEQRRKFVRLDTRIEVTYTVLPSTHERRTVTKNIGGGGICFFAEEVLAPGTHIRAAMRLPDRQLPVSFTAEVVWSEAYEVVGQTERRKAVEVGVRFLEIAPEDQQAIMQHVVLSLKPPEWARG